MVPLSQNVAFHQQVVSFYKTGFTNTLTTNEEAKAYAFTLQDAVKVNADKNPVLTAFAANNIASRQAVKKIDRHEKAKFLDIFKSKKNDVDIGANPFFEPENESNTLNLFG